MYYVLNAMCYGCYVLGVMCYLLIIRVQIKIKKFVYIYFCFYIHKFLLPNTKLLLPLYFVFVFSF